MPTFKVSGTEIQGVTEAHVVIIHHNPKAPDPVPNMQWELKLRLQFDDLLPKWALAKQSEARFKKCELQIKNNNDQLAHTWTILNAYIHEYEEVEHPGAVADTSGEGGFYLRLVIRGHMLEAKDYTGENVMTVAKGVERKLPA